MGFSGCMSSAQSDAMVIGFLLPICVAIIFGAIAVVIGTLRGTL